jgi:hypothetical protein
MAARCVRGITPVALLLAVASSSLSALQATSPPSALLQIAPPEKSGYRPKQPYRLPGLRGVTTLSPDPVVEANAAGDFLTVLRSWFPQPQGPNPPSPPIIDYGWTFTTSPVPLQGAFFVEHYLAFGNEKEVGANFRVSYQPLGTDPTPQTAELHWIQMVTSNHVLTPNQHGPTVSVIDFPPGQSNPYYDFRANANETFFSDGPRRRDPDRAHDWDALLFLVQVPNAARPKEVVVLGGMSWGWENTVTPTNGGGGGRTGAIPEPTSVLMLGSGLLALVVVWQRKRGRWAGGR